MRRAGRRRCQSVLVSAGVFVHTGSQRGLDKKGGEMTWRQRRTMPGPWTDCNHRVPDARLAALLTAFPAGLFDERLYRSIHWADAYVTALSMRVLAALEAPDALVEPVAAADLHRRLRLAPGFERRLEWLLEWAVAAGVLATTDGNGLRTYCWAMPWAAVDVEGLADACLAIDAGNRPTAALLDAAAAAWPRVARGEASGEAVLLGPEAIGLWLDYFDNANLLYAANNRVAAIVAANQVANWERFSILELGAGAGSGTEALLLELEQRGQLDRLTRYLVTEPGTFFRRRGERKLKPRFRDCPLRFAALDIDRPWAEQGIEGGAFDLIFGVNVLHVAKDLAFSLREARSCLAPGGSLVAGECLRPFPQQGVYIEFVFQLLDSFAAVTTDPERRPRAGFLTPEEWQRSFIEAGFGGVGVLPDLVRTREIFPGLLIAAICGR